VGALGRRLGGDLPAALTGVPNETKHSRRRPVVGKRTTAPGGNLTFFWPGPLFLLSLLRLRAGILICGAGTRLPCIDLVAHAADVLMLVPLAHIGMGYPRWRGRDAPPVARAA